MFARNEGNEGTCSAGIQKLALPHDRLSLQIPWRPGANTARVTFTGNTRVPTADYTAPLRITVPLSGKPTGLVDGQFTVEWDVASRAPQRGPRHLAFRPPPEQGGEERATEVGRGLSVPVQPPAGGAISKAAAREERVRHDRADSLYIAALCEAKAQDVPGVCRPDAERRPR